MDGPGIRRSRRSRPHFFDPQLADGQGSAPPKSPTDPAAKTTCDQHIRGRVTRQRTAKRAVAGVLAAANPQPSTTRGPDRDFGQPDSGRVISEALRGSGCRGECPVVGDLSDPAGLEAQHLEHRSRTRPVDGLPAEPDDERRRAAPHHTRLGSDVWVDHPGALFEDRPGLSGTVSGRRPAPQPSASLEPAPVDVVAEQGHQWLEVAGDRGVERLLDVPGERLCHRANGSCNGNRRSGKAHVRVPWTACLDGTSGKPYLTCSCRLTRPH